MTKAFTALTALIWLAAAPNALAACWRVVPEQSRLVFIASQAGGTVQGHFNQYSGLVCVDTGDAAQLRVEAAVDLASVETELPELDDALRGSDFFDVQRWPKAAFKASAMRALGGDRYEVTGTVQLRDVSREITVPVTLTPDPDGAGANLQTRLTLARLKYGIGQGEWADTQWVGDEVAVELTARLLPVTASALGAKP